MDRYRIATGKIATEAEIIEDKAVEAEKLLLKSALEQEINHRIKGSNNIQEPVGITGVGGFTGYQGSGVGMTGIQGELLTLYRWNQDVWVAGQGSVNQTLGITEMKAEKSASLFNRVMGCVCGVFEFSRSYFQNQ